MIRNDKQYHTAKKQLKDMKEALAASRENYTKGDLLALLEIGSAVSMTDNIAEEIAEYEGLQNGTLTTTTLQHLGQLPELLIKARIAKKWTQAELANKVGLKEQQIQRYESTDYAGASTWKLLFILDALNVTLPPIQVQLNPASTIRKGIESSERQQHRQTPGS